ncbi:MAG: GNAT family N-acetyltransferase [Eubacteriales bacterium]|nr:GNAT family N-acetyltransferase [Eubacteriales bacterium]
MIIETERLFIRPFNINDLNDFYEYAAQPDVGPNAGWKPHESLEEALEILERFSANPQENALVFKENNKVIGAAGVYNDDANKSVMIGYVMNHDYWGRGLMTEAVKAVINEVFSAAETKNVVIKHFPFNSRSKRVIEKCGLKHIKNETGTFTRYDGTALDECVWNISREEWIKSK